MPPRGLEPLFGLMSLDGVRAPSYYCAPYEFFAPYGQAGSKLVPKRGENPLWGPLSAAYPVGLGLCPSMG